MKRIAFFILGWIFLVNTPGITQLIKTSPAIPIDNQAVTITFNADDGDKGLMGYTGDVYAHTGVLTDSSTSGSDWRYVKAAWNINIPACKLIRIATDQYQLIMSPSIREFYGVPAGEEIRKMAFVFRNPDGTKKGYDIGGGDIFVSVYVEGLTLSILQPAVFPSIIGRNDTLVIEISARESDSIALYRDDQLLLKSSGDHLTDTLIGEDFGKFLMKAIASNDTGAIADSFYYIVRKPADIREMPEGIIRDGINYIDTTTIVLSLFAPNKEFAYIIGDFNNWEIDSNYLMHQTPDGKRFWLEISNLIPRQEYIFQYLVDGKLRVGDPYADKISDPANDKYITGATYPGLISYPAGKTTNIATVLQTGQTSYNWEINVFMPAPSSELVIYEMLVRDFTAKHSYQAIIDTLGYLQRLGVNAIELMPVSEFEGNVGWGYNPSFYFAPDKYYGPKNDLKRLIDECHKRNIAVIMDMVLNHAYDQCPFVQLYFDGQKPTAQNPWFNVDHNFTNPDAHWGNDFNHESQATQQLVDSINSYWLKEYKFDGFRFDFTKGFGNNIKGSDDSWGSNYDADRIRLLKRMTGEIRNRDSNAIVIMEHLAVNQEEEELADYGILLWGNMNYNYAEAAMGWNESSKSDFSGISYKNRTWSKPHLVGYMESHDEERLMYKCITWGNGAPGYQIQDTSTALLRMLLNAVFFITVPGPKMIWQFGERGYDISIDSLGRLGEKPANWEYLANPLRLYLFNFYSALIDLKKNYPVFHTDDYTMAVSTSLKRIVLRHDDMNVVIIGNFGIQEGTISGEFPHTGKWYDYFPGDSIEVANAGDLIALKAGEYHLYTEFRLLTPDIGTGRYDNPVNNFPINLIVYPNPATDRITVSGLPADLISQATNLYHIEIVDMTGRIALDKAIDPRWQSAFIDLSLLKAGAYLVLLKENGKAMGWNKLMLVK